MIAHDLLDLSFPRRLHLLGIGGSGMAPFARLLLDAGHDVSGADLRESGTVEDLRRRGVRVLTGAEADLLPADVEAIIHTAALPAEAPPLRQARKLRLPTLKYARAVGVFARGKRTYAVAGTHGKTTTSAMLSYVFEDAGYDPTFLVGGAVPQLAGPGGGERFVVEACEYDRSFLHFRPEAAIVTNIEPDHLDYYQDIVEIEAAFRAFAAQVDDLLVLREDLKIPIGRAGGVRAKVVTFGESPEADLRIERVSRLSSRRFRALGREFQVGMPGLHNVWNAAAVLAVAREAGIDLDIVARALEGFGGVGRRLQVVGRPRGVSVIDDYAHHPTEVRAGLSALRDEYAPSRLWVVFQPHQYSRLRRFLDDFASALSAADRIVIPTIYAARDRDEDRRAVTEADLVAAVRKRGGDAVFIPDFKVIVDFVRAQARPGDVVVTMGAGDVGDVAGRLAASL